MSMKVSAAASHKAHHTSKPPPAWMHGLTKVVNEHRSTLSQWEQLGPDSADATTPQGAALLAKFPAGVQAFFKSQMSAAADNDGSVALLKIPLSSVSSRLHGAATAVRWTSEDQQLDRLFVYDTHGKPLTKGWTDTGGAFRWHHATAPFQIDDSPHPKAQ
jgi:hypothetical protein